MTLKTKTEWRQAIRELPVFDTHTHMNKPGVPIAAQNVWDIVEYFWFRQELESVGYPGKLAEDMDESERIDLFVDAFTRCRNTTWAQVIQNTLRDLYGLEISDAESIRKVDEAVKASAARDDWPGEVVKKMNVTRIVTNIEEDADYPGLPGVGAAAPIWRGYQEWTEKILKEGDPKAVGEEALNAIYKDIAGIAARGYRGMRVHANAFQNRPVEEKRRLLSEGDTLPEKDITENDVAAFLAHGIFSALSKQEGMFAQFFLGIFGMHDSGIPMGLGDDYIVGDMYHLFKRYDCDFELVAGSPRLNTDIVQAARILPNVYAGGLWWCNFRPSFYREIMQKRLEGVPPEKCTLLCSDGRCIEWCYAKTMLVKNLLADFLFEQVRDDQISETDALWVAREWLHDAAARRYV
jgi:glucuronate isomerase